MLKKSILFLFLFGILSQVLCGQQSYIQVGADNAYFPFEYMDEEEKPVGFDIDLLQALMKHSSFDVEITSGDWFIIKDKMERGEFDMLAGMYYNPDRAERYDFSIPYIIITHSIFVKQGNKIGSLNELKEDKTMRIVVENSSILHKYLTTNGILPERILAVENQLDALLLVDDSYSTCALLPDLQAKYIAKKNGLDDIKTVGFPILPREYAFAVSKGDTLLLNTLNAGLTQMHRSGEYEKIFEKWFGKYHPTFSVLDEGFSIFLLVSLFLTSILIIVYLFMKFRLKKIVSENRKLNAKLEQINLVLKDMHKSETFLKRIIEFSPFPITMLHKDGYFVFSNSGFEDLFGEQSDRVGSVNRWVSLTFKKEHELNLVKNHFFYKSKDIISQKSDSSLFSLTTRKGTEELMHLSFVPIGNGQLLIFFSKYDANKDKASEFYENKVKSLFLPNFSHEIRSPMNIIMGFSEIMGTEDLSIEEVKSYARSIYRNGQKLLYLLKNMGAFSKIDSGELPIKHEIILASELVNYVYKEYLKGSSSEFANEILCVDKTPEEILIKEDREILIQILLNLLLYTDEIVDSKPAIIGCELVSENEMQIYFEAVLDDELYQDLMQKIKVFQNNSEAIDQLLSSGSNLSLYISLLLIKLIGSNVEMNRNENSGKVKFAFSLSRISKESSAKKYKAGNVFKNKQHYKWKGKRILIADANRESLDYFKFMFKSSSAEIIIVNNGREAYEQCRKEAKIDLILMDWLMPIMDGETSTKLIKQLEPSLPIIAVTAFVEEDERSKIFQSGCSAYYPKPVDTEDLLNYINTLFEY